MERRHYVPIDWLDGAPPAEVAALSADTLALLAEDLALAEEKVRARRKTLDAALAAKYAANPQPGTGWVTDGRLAVRVEVPKTVEWDQGKLREASAQIESWGENPAEFIVTKLSVLEGSYKAWPASIRAVVDPARTVKPGKPRVTFHEPKAEAA